MGTARTPNTDFLVEQARQGNASARQELLVRHRSRLRRMVGVHLDRRLAVRVDPSDVVQEALARWEATGLTAAQVGLLHSVSFQVADLGGTTLGLQSGTVITVDDNAAGWGWFVDATPSDDSEFRKPGNQGEQNHMDLLTVLMHEMGHVLGLDHEPRGVMQETLDPGTRLSPSLLDLHFAGLADSADVALAVALADEAHKR